MKNSYLPGLLLAGLALAARPAQAQSEFHPGYLVRPTGDTVRGFVDYRGARRNSLVCQFRPTADAPTEVVPPQAARAYGVWGEVAYRSALTPQPDSAGQPQAPRRYFLEVLVSGPPAALYQWRVGSKEARYYVQKDPAAPLRELRVEHRAVTEGVRQYTQDLPVFRGVLSEQFADCPELLLSLARTEFTAASLEAAVRRYNACRLPGVAAAAPAPRRDTGFALEVLLGGQASSLTAYGNVHPINGKFDSGLRFEGGVGISISSPRLRNKLALRLEALYGQQEYEDTYSSSIGLSAFGPYTYQTHFQTSYLRVPVLVRYAPLPGRVQPFVEAGPTFSPLLSITQESRYRTSNSATATYNAWKPTYDPADVRNFEFGVLAGVGLRFTGLAGRSAAVLGRVEGSNGFLQTPVNSNSVLRYHLLLTLGLTRQP